MRHLGARYAVAALFCSACLMSLSPTDAHAQQGSLAAERERVNSTTVGLITARADSAFTRFGNDLAVALDSDELRILATLGSGSLKNVEDLLLLSKIDFAFTQGDILTFLERLDFYPNIKNHVHYVAAFSDEEMHILARPGITSIQDLEGLTVNWGKENTGTFLTSSIVFDKLGITVDVTSEPHKKAYEMLKAGEIDAMVKVDGKPVKLIEDASLDDAVHLIRVPIEGLEDIYNVAELGSNDYPALFAAGDTVQTISVPSVLAVYNFSKGNERRQRTDQFITDFFAKFEELKDPSNGFDQKWAEIDLAEEVPGWTRASKANELLSTQ